jgi:hypothetical protein
VGSAGHKAIVGTLIIAFGMGLYSFMAIRQTARRRSALVDEVVAQIPSIPGARVVQPWEPAAYADDVRAMYCLDEADPRSGAERAMQALTAAGWKTTEARHDTAADTFVFLMSGPLRLRGGVARGTRTDCDGARRQVTLAFDGTR